MPHRRTAALQASLTFTYCGTSASYICILGLERHAELSERYRHWNEALQSRSKDFTSENKRVSLFLFSSYRVVSSILDDPEEYGFQSDDVSQEGGGIWADELHLTSDVHAILAERLEKALRTADRTHKSTE